MNITSAQYFRGPLSGEVNSIVATIDGQEMYVPISTGNRHYQAILEWAEEDGNEIQAAE